MIADKTMRLIALVSIEGFIYRNRADIMFFSIFFLKLEGL